MHYDPMYRIIMLPALILAGIAPAKTRGLFNKSSRVAARSRLCATAEKNRNGVRSGILFHTLLLKEHLATCIYSLCCCNKREGFLF